MLLAGRSIAEVARTFACTRPTIYMLQRRLRQTGTTSDRPRSVRPKVTTPREDRMIRLAPLRNRFLPATVTATTIPRRPVSPRTVRRRLRQVGLRARRPHVGIILTRRHRQERLRWARAHFNWRRVRWNTVIFSDESRFRLMNAYGRIRVHRRRGERYADACVNQVDGHNRSSVMVINDNLTVQRYRDRVLAREVVPFINQNGPGLTLQQDNARPHTARIVQVYLRRQHVNVLPWPDKSPGFSPIEHIWDELCRKVRDVHTLDDLRNVLIEEWNNLPADTVQRYVNSIRRRLTPKEVIFHFEV